MDIRVIITGNGFSNLSSNPGQGCISLHNDALGKGMNPFVLPPPSYE